MKDKHGLTYADLHPTDLMSFGPTEKIMRKTVIELLKKHVPHSEGTVVLLRYMSDIYRAFTDETLDPLESISMCWYTFLTYSLGSVNHNILFPFREAMFFMRGWRNWSIKTQGTNFRCITPNTYSCLELNAHNLVLAARSCRDRGKPEEFLVKHFGSQDVESEFRHLRSMTTMNHTQTNVTFKELGEKLRRSHMCQQIEHRNCGDFKFQTHSKAPSQSRPRVFPRDDQIKAALDLAQARASDVLATLGIEYVEQSFEFSITARGIRNWEELIETDTDSDSEYDEEPEEACQQVFEAKDIFSNCTGLVELPHSSSGKHVYLIRDDLGRVCQVQKRTIVWMLTDRVVQDTKARMVRFKQAKPRRNAGSAEGHD